MTSLDLAFSLIAIVEGIKLTSYYDHSGAVWTIGFGHTKDVTQGQVISLDQANQFFQEDAAPLYELVKERPIFEGAAYISFGYNVGKGALKIVLSADPKLILHYNHSGGLVLDNLTRRRNLEYAMIMASRQK